MLNRCPPAVGRAARPAAA